MQSPRKFQGVKSEDGHGPRCRGLPLRTTTLFRRGTLPLSLWPVTYCVSLSDIWRNVYFLADRPLLSTVALMLQCCIRLSSSSVCTECIVAKRCVIESKFYYWEPIGSRIWEVDWYQNEWRPLFRGRIKVMSTIALHSTLNTLETVRDRGLVNPKENQ